MVDAILTINAGSSSVKYATFNAGTFSRITHGHLEGHDFSQVLEHVKSASAGVTVLSVAHRVVHGGLFYDSTVFIDETVIRNLKKLIPLSPLHLPPEIKAIEAIAELNASLPQVACFDTAFHSTSPRLARLFAIPNNYSKEGIVRYGFHGLSYAYIVSRLPEIVGDKANGRVIVAHLGNGSSMCAVHESKSVATTMGFTALDGLMMGTRCGSIDPGIVLYLMEEKGLTSKEISDILNLKSGLLGVSGISNDLRDLENSDAPEAKEAIDLYCYCAACELVKLLPSIGGIDVIVFTAGIGENSPIIRKKICDYLGWLGVSLDDKNNSQSRVCISDENSSVVVYVLPTNEEVVMAKQAAKLMQSA